MIIYKVKTPLWWRTRLYKPCTVLKKIKIKPDKLINIHTYSTVQKE